MNKFFEWFSEFFTVMFKNFLEIFKGFFVALINFFDISVYIEQFKNYKEYFKFTDWFFAIMSLILVVIAWLTIFLLIVIFVLKAVRSRRDTRSRDELLEEIGCLHKDIDKLVSEKNMYRTKNIGGETDDNIKSYDSSAGAFKSFDNSVDVFASTCKYSDNETGESVQDKGKSIKNTEYNNQENFNSITNFKENIISDSLSDKDSVGVNRKYDFNSISGTNMPVRFPRLKAIDDSYKYYVAPEYKCDFTLSELCEKFRNFACSELGLFYDMDTVRLIFAGLSVTKLIILQGISGTGKTSLPYAMGKFFENNASVISVQPSWKDKTELFGYFNEFTKKFSETEMLRRIYESSFKDDMNFIILDEMNIARVEYYFAEMLSVMEIPNSDEWKIELVQSVWDSDPQKLDNGKLKIPENLWFVGTANNDDTTFSISDKVYDRAFTLNIDNKGIPFEAEKQDAYPISFLYLDGLYKNAVKNNCFEQSYIDKIAILDSYVTRNFHISFGNRIMKQLKKFVPVYVECGGKIETGIDHMLATKVFRKFESLNLSFIRDEIGELINQIDIVFGKDQMKISIEYLKRLQKMY